MEEDEKKAQGKKNNGTQTRSGAQFSDESVTHTLFVNKHLRAAGHGEKKYKAHEPSLMACLRFGYNNCKKKVC